MLARVIILLAAMVAAPAFGSAWLAEHQVVLPSGRPIGVTLPGGMFVQVTEDEEGNPLLEVSNDEESLLLRASFGEQNTSRVSDPDAQRAYLSRSLAVYLEESLERHMRFKSLTTADATGMYCIFSDAHLPRDQPPPEGEWIYLTAGMRAWSTWYVEFRLFSNHLDSPDYEALMDALRDGFREM